MSILHRRAFLARHNEKLSEEKTNEQGQNSIGPIQEGQQSGENGGTQGRQAGGAKKEPVVLDPLEYI